MSTSKLAMVVAVVAAMVLTARHRSQKMAHVDQRTVVPFAGIGPMEIAAHPLGIVVVGRHSAVMAANLGSAFPEARLPTARVDLPMVTPCVAPMLVERVVRRRVSVAQMMLSAGATACKSIYSLSLPSMQHKLRPTLVCHSGHTVARVLIWTFQ